MSIASRAKRVVYGSVAACILTAVPFSTAVACQSTLTGRLLDPVEVRSFGAVQGLAPLPLNAGEYVISIDDGPLPKTTPALADILRKACVHGTFFFVGRRLNAHPELAVAVQKDGDSVGSHSFTHPDFSKLDAAGRLDELSKGVEALKRALGKSPEAGTRPLYVRFPGAIGLSPHPSSETIAAVEDKGWIVAGYDISPEDWRNSPPEESFARLKKRLGDRGVIVFHDGQPNTLLLLPMVLNELARRGATVVSLP